MKGGKTRERERERERERQRERDIRRTCTEYSRVEM